MNRYATFIKTINLTVDYILLNVSMIITYYMVDNLLVLWVHDKNHLSIALVFNLTWLLSANITRFYDKVLNKDSVIIIHKAVKTYLLFVSLISCIVLVIGIKTYFITNSYVVYVLALFGLLLAIWKLIFLAIRKSDRALLYDSRKVVIVGSGRIGNDLHNFFNNNLDRGYKLVGFFFDDDNPLNNKDMHLGKVDECINYVLAHKIKEIFCALPASESDRIRNLLMESDKNLIRFKVVPEYYDYGVIPLQIESFGHIPVISLRPEPLENILNRMIKRVFDIFFSLFIIIFLCSWLFPILSVLIKLESKGPTFFKQLRSGKDNKAFWCFKFRSMKVNFDSDSLQAIKNDARITKLGKFLRKTSIDELPQFYNVLLGNMSIVGPRPHMLNHTTQYSQLIDRYMIRHFLKPGITGYAQINGFRGETRTTKEMQLRVEADVWYLENWSFILDLKIILFTVWNSLKGDDKAY